MGSLDGRESGRRLAKLDTGDSEADALMAALSEYADIPLWRIRAAYACLAESERAAKKAGMRELIADILSGGVVAE